MKKAGEAEQVARKKQHRNNQANKQPAEDTTHQHQHRIVDPWEDVLVFIPQHPKS